MGQLVLGLVGAVAGFAIGGPFGAAIGWSVGTLAGSLLFPTKVQGPRLKDTSVQGAEYGTMRPILFGTMRIGGIGMGQGSTANGPNKFTEEEHKHGGKGGPEVTDFTYRLSFWNEICEGPIVGVRKRWANGRLLTDEEVDNPDTWPYTLYLGDTTQLPDPTMEVVYGVGEVSPMRGVAYEAIEEVQVGDFGNARPNVEYEAFTNTGDVPVRIAEFRPWNEDVTGAAFNYGASYRNGVITTGSLDTGAADFFRSQWDINGNQIGTTTTSNGCGGAAQAQVRNSPRYAVYAPGGSVYQWYGESAVFPFVELVVTGDYINSPGNAGLVGNGNIYLNGYFFGPEQFGGVSIINRLRAPNGDPLPTAIAMGSPPPVAGEYVSLDAAYSNSIVALGNDTKNNKLYVMVNVGTPGTKMWRVNPEDMTIEKFWDVSETSGTDLRAHGNFFVWNGLVCFQSQLPDTFWYIKLVKIDANDFLADYGVPLPSASTVSQNFTIQLNGCIGMDEMGTFTLCPQPASVILGDIVSAILQRNPQGLDEAQIDVTDLTQEVRGFLIGSQMTKANAIQTLREGFFFDVSEWDGVIHAVNRGHDSIADIPDGDLGAHEPGSEPPEPLETTRTPEAELPQTIFVNYYDVDNDYQKGTQYWSRQVTSSQTKTTVDLPIVLTADEALAIAQWHMYFAWLEREQFTWFTSRKWSALCPTDVVTVRGRDIRITTKTESPSGLIKWEGVLAFAGPYAPFVPLDEVPGFIPGSPGDGQPPQIPPQIKATSQLVLLDIPYRTPYPFGFTAAMGPSQDGPWQGAGLYKSLDGGVTYNAIVSTQTQSAIGYATSALANYTGGTVLDTASGPITIVLADADSTLESCTSGALANGANLCALKSGSGWELFQFQNATLLSERTWQISQPYYRGVNGSSAFNAGHATGDQFVLLPAVPVDAPQSELNVALKYKAVTIGMSVADATEQTFTNTGLSNTQWAGNPPVLPKPITAGTYTILSSDRGKLLSFNNAGGVAVTLPQAGVNFPNGWWVTVQNTGTGNVVITPTTSTIDGASSLTLTTGHGATISSNGTNYFTSSSTGSSPPSGAAGGDLTGTYPNPTLAAIITAGGPTGDATHVAQITYDAKGRLTAVGSVAITAAPVGAQYVTLATDATLTSERVLTAGNNITLNDGGAGGALTISASGGGGTIVGGYPSTCMGRLTLTSGVPVTTADVTGATSIFFTPYKGAQVSLHDGASTWTTYSFTELTLALGTLAAAFQAYDVFIFDNSGTPQLESLEWSHATVTITAASPGVVTWTGNTLANGNTIVFTTGGTLPTGLSPNVRYYVVSYATTFSVSATPGGTAINTTGGSGTHTGHAPHARQTALTTQDGVLVKSGDSTRRYLGTFVSTATTTTEDSAGGVTTQVGGKRYLWNYYNRVMRGMGVIETTNSWNYTLATLRAANGATANRVEVVIGVAECMLTATVMHAASGSGAKDGIAAGVGVDSSSVNSAQWRWGSAFTTIATMVRAEYQGYPTVGYHFYQWQEVSVASGTTTWYGDLGDTYWQTGMWAACES